MRATIALRMLDFSPSQTGGDEISPSVGKERRGKMAKFAGLQFLSALSFP
ncbi:hypothetical protein RLEG12_26655 [Rhizobium leguminosarum bv. trifolii CB782]|nr:hypothetical protein RLEG12_26655 [Rhizobium leguminosarum bv. trifolii CB782]